jgi:nucleotide-binding universal stress UspA family protein
VKTNQSIKHIVCTVRGQPESRKTVIKAIDLALENDARLTFALILNAEFLSKVTPVMTSLSVVHEQLENMGEFSMLILKDRAERRGVSRVDHLIRIGDVEKELRKLALETSANMLVLGRPVPGRRTSVFKPKEFNRFIAEIESETNMVIVQVDHS